jgi:hypothetical protein
MRPWHRFVFPLLGYFRSRRGKVILSHFPNIREYRILDLGGSVHFWRESGLYDLVKRVDIYNISESEVLRTAVDEKFFVYFYDGRRLPVASGSYDLVVSNSVLEHVPPELRHQFVEEARRVGKRGYVQTPAFEFPVEPHFVMPFLHWLPRAIGVQLIRIAPWALLSGHRRHVQLAYWNEIKLLTRKQLQALFPDSIIVAERVLGLPKSWLIIWRGEQESRAHASCGQAANNKSAS